MFFLIHFAPTNKQIYNTLVNNFVVNHKNLKQITQKTILNAYLKMFIDQSYALNFFLYYISLIGYVSFVRIIKNSQTVSLVG